MVDKGVLKQKLGQLSEYLADLQEFRSNTSLTLSEFSADKKNLRYAERTLYLVVECCLDIGGHIIADEGFREPLNNKDVFAVLAENKIIDQEESVSLQKMAQFRNLLVHDYARVDPEIIYRIIQQNLDDISKFAVKVKSAFLA